MIARFGKHSVDLRPFVWATLLWTVVSVGALSSFSEDPGAALRSLAIYLGLAIFDLFFLVKTVAATLVLMSDQGAKNRTAYAIQALVYGGLKFAGLGAIGLCLWKIPSTTSGGILFGLGAIVAIPLLGGFLWSRREIKESES
jgi:FtsH-binding integral membrane protein